MHGGVLQVLSIVNGLKLLSVAVCGVVFTVLTVLRRLNSSATVMTICFVTLLTMNTTFCINCYLKEHLMTIKPKTKTT